MTGPEHYRESERLAELVTEYPEAFDAPVLVAAAQVHATLALAAATAYPIARYGYDGEDSGGCDWAQVTS